MRLLAGNAVSRYVESLNSSLEVLIRCSLRRHYPNQVIGVDPSWILSAKAPPSPIVAPVDSQRATAGSYTLNELPQPQLPVTLGLLNLKPAPCNPSI